MHSDVNLKNELHTDEEMLKKILLRQCGECETDEFAADELELMESLRDKNPEIGESEYFSTCEYTMIPTDDDAINSQGS